MLGVRVMRYSGVQGATLVFGNLVALASVLVVAAYLGPEEMGRFALLLFLAGLVTTLLSLLVKPGTIRRTFGGGDDEDDDEEADEEVSTSPPHTLGAGLAWAAVLGVLGAGAVALAREPLADLLLGDGGDPTAVVWAGVLAGVWLVFKVADITLWLERRPGAFAIADASRPVLGLVAVLAFLAAGAGVEGAVIGTAIGTGLAALVALALLRGSFEPNLDLAEVRQIVIRGGPRVPIVLSFWIVQNADVFLLSRFIDPTELGLYTLASRLGFVVSFLPQGFRVAMRPLRKSAAFMAVRDQYGKRTLQGQLLGYFSILCIFAVLAMVLGGGVLVGIAPAAYADAVALIPFTAAAFVMPSIYRTVNQNVNLAHKRTLFILGCLGAAAAFIALTVALAPAIGAYAAPVGMLVGFGLPSLLMFARNQMGAKPIDYPYRAVATALALAAAIGAGFELLDGAPLVELGLALALLGIFLAALVPLRVIPEYHRRPLLHTVRSLGRGTPASFRPRRGLRALEPELREELRVAVIAGLPAAALAPAADAPAPAPDDERGVRLLRALRRVGARGGLPIAERTGLDREIAAFAFVDAPTAVRNASMRALVESGADPNDLRALEDLVAHLARVPDDAWEGRRSVETPRPRPGVARRRQARRRRELRRARADRP